jgi:CubicO group peptidase (beta-lactamase class C family)
LIWAAGPQPRQVGQSPTNIGTVAQGCRHAQRAGPDYGYLWWLNTKRKEWPSGPASSFAAIGNGGNTIWIDPDDDIVLVWHWGSEMDGMVERIVGAVTGP